MKDGSEVECFIGTIIIKFPYYSPVRDQNVHFMVLEGDGTKVFYNMSPPFAKGQCLVVSVLDSIMSMVKKRDRMRMRDRNKNARS